jgi:hypothetical protein
VEVPETCWATQKHQVINLWNWKFCEETLLSGQLQNQEVEDKIY